MKILLASVLLGVMLACKPVSQGLSQHDKTFPLLTDSLQTGFRFKQLWDSLASYRQTHASTDSFQPSEDLRLNCSMQEENGTYYVSGYLKFKESNTDAPKAPASVRLSHYAGNIYGFRVRLNQLSDLIKLKDLIYIELNSKIMLHK